MEIGAATSFEGSPAGRSDCPVPVRRRFALRVGLQGKLLLCFMAMLSIALGTSYWVFIRQSSDRIAQTTTEHARQVAYVLAQASKSPLAANHAVELTSIGQDLLKSRNVLFLAFLDADAKPLVLTSRDPDLTWKQLHLAHESPQSLLQARQEVSPLFGEYLRVVAPVLSMPTPVAGVAHEKGTRLLGYVAVGMSQAPEQAQLRTVAYSIVGVGCVIVMLCLPLAYYLVYRVCGPIRQLVGATNKIIEGDLDTRVAIDRPDVIGTLARSFNDMVQRVKQQQTALAEANQDLEEKVLQRTAQWETANKRLSNEIAEKEDFLRAVSHDLNAPLRNIGGMTSMLLMKGREKLDQDAIHRLERIQKNVEAETELISELLELSRIKSRRQKMEMVDVGAMVQELGGVFEDDLGRREIEFAVDGSLPVLNCEKSRVRQVFQNLIDNAIKYMGEGPGKAIHVGCTLREAEAEFYVRDTGMGIAPEDLDKVFFVFRRGKNSATQNVPGKGVGLASVKSIIETYGGRIWVESKVGEGSVFRFTFGGQYVPVLAGGEKIGLRTED